MKANVRRDIIDSVCAAAVDRNGNFRRESRGERCSRHRLSQLRGYRSGVQDFVCGESGQRMGDNRDAVRRRDAEPCYSVGEVGR